MALIGMEDMEGLLGRKESYKKDKKTKAKKRQRPSELHTYSKGPSSDLDGGQIDNSSDGEESYKLGYTVLSVLYLIQGVPVGLCMGTLPYLVKPKVSYSEIALLTLASYPYSLKLLWSPIVDTWYLKKIGRRKSWIVPTQILAGVLMVLGGKKAENWVNNVDMNVEKLAVSMFLLVFLFSTQDIAVDGWALTLLPKNRRYMASTIQSVFLSVGFFLSFTVFIAFNSKEFCNKYIFSVARSHGLIQLGSYLRFWGVVLILCSLYLILFVKERPCMSDKIKTIKLAYTEGIKVMRLSSIKFLVIILLLCKVPFIASEEIGPLSIFERLPREYSSVVALVDFPVEIFASYICTVLARKRGPIDIWLRCFYMRLLMILVSMTIFYNASSIVNGSIYCLMLMLFEIIFTSLGRTIQFSSTGSFFNIISDDLMGGTYMTLLNTVSNLGGTWPKYFLMKSVDYFTVARCSTNPSVRCVHQGVDKYKVLESNLGDDFNCGECVILKNGYYYTTLLSLAFGVIFILTFAKRIKSLESLPSEAWRTNKLVPKGKSKKH